MDATGGFSALRASHALRRWGHKKVLADDAFAASFPGPKLEWSLRGSSRDSKPCCVEPAKRKPGTLGASGAVRERHPSGAVANACAPAAATS